MKLMTDEQVYNYKNENPSVPWRTLCVMMTGKPQHGADAQHIDASRECAMKMKAAGIHASRCLLQNPMMILT
jgi:hypothetical protein